MRPSTILIILLILFSALNPVAGLDVLALVGLGVILLYKILGDYALIVVLALRPGLDYWRDYAIFSYRDFTLNLTAALSIFITLTAIFFLWRHRKKIAGLPHRGVLAMLVGWAALSWWWSIAPFDTMIEGLKLLNLAALFAIGWTLHENKAEPTERALISGALAGAALPFAAALYQWVTNTGATIDDIPGRLYGTFAHPNVLAAFAIIMLLLFWAAGQKTLAASKLSKRWYHALIGLALFIILFSYTRMAWIGILLSLSIYWLIKKPRLLLLFAAAGASFYLLFYPVNDFLSRRYGLNLQSYSLVARLTKRNPEADSLLWRQELYAKIFPLYLTRPIVGWGYGAFPKVWDDQKSIANLFDTSSETHNDYLKILFELGPVGLALYLAFFGWLLKNQIRYGRQNSWINLVFIVSVAVYLLMSVSDNMLHHTPAAWWFFALWGMWASKYKPA